MSAWKSPRIEAQFEASGVVSSDPPKIWMRLKGSLGVVTFSFYGGTNVAGRPNRSLALSVFGPTSSTMVFHERVEAEELNSSLLEEFSEVWSRAFVASGQDPLEAVVRGFSVGGVLHSWLEDTESQLKMNAGEGEWMIFDERSGPYNQKIEAALQAAVTIPEAS